MRPKRLAASQARRRIRERLVGFEETSAAAAERHSAPAAERQSVEVIEVGALGTHSTSELAGYREFPMRPQRLAASQARRRIRERLVTFEETSAAAAERHSASAAERPSDPAAERRSVEVIDVGALGTDSTSELARYREFPMRPQRLAASQARRRIHERFERSDGTSAPAAARPPVEVIDVDALFPDSTSEVEVKTHNMNQLGIGKRSNAFKRREKRRRGKAQRKLRRNERIAKIAREFGDSLVIVFDSEDEREAYGAVISRREGRNSTEER